MASITSKTINGSTYYYVEQREWKDGKSKRKWQKYLGTLDNIINAVEGKTAKPEFAVVFELGAVVALHNISQEIKMRALINDMYPEREQGLSIGHYIELAAINRSIEAVSKRSMWDWFETTVLINKFSDIKKETISSQRFWDNMDMIKENDIPKIWDNIIQTVITQYKIDLSLISYDGTNYYTFIGSFNQRDTIAQRSKNKQGRKDLRQINYALFCSREDHIPLYFDIYEGNTHDSKEFNKIIGRFKNTFADKIKEDSSITIIFDKGNNSPDNIKEFDDSKFNFVGSVKLDDHKDLSQISNKDERLEKLMPQHLENIKAFRTTKEIYSKQRTIVVTFNTNLYNAQVKTIQIEINKCMKELSLLNQRLQDRANGIIVKGKKPTISGVKNTVAEILKRQYMKSLIKIEYSEQNNTPVFAYSVDMEQFAQLCDTYLGKKIIFTDNHHWKTEDIIDAYHNQYVVEEAFKETKDRHYGCWWPMYHYTDKKIKVHGLYCTISLLLNSLIKRKVRLAGMNLSIHRILDKLIAIKQVINYCPNKKKKGKTKMTTHETLTKMDEIQVKLYDILKINKFMAN